MLSKPVRIKPWDIPIITLSTINLGLTGEIICRASNFYNVATQVTGKDTCSPLSPSFPLKMTTVCG